MSEQLMMEVVRTLQSCEELQPRGTFRLRDAVESVIPSIVVARFAIYHHLDEIRDQSAVPPRGPTRPLPCRRS